MEKCFAALLMLHVGTFSALMLSSIKRALEEFTFNLLLAQAFKFMQSPNPSATFENYSKPSQRKTHRHTFDCISTATTQYHHSHPSHHRQLTVLTALKQPIIIALMNHLWLNLLLLLLCGSFSGVGVMSLVILSSNILWHTPTQTFSLKFHIITKKRRTRRDLKII
jgi:hypothetical protein